MHGITAQSQGQGPYAVLYAPTTMRQLPFGGSATTGVDRTAIVKCSERMVRQSDEYKRWIAVLHAEVGLSRCMVLNEIQSTPGVSIEIHHFPLSLFDLCWAVSGRQKQENSRYSSASVADEVLGIHFEWKVGAIPLCATVHQLHHSGVLPLSLEMVWGYWEQAAQQYWNYFPRHVPAKIERARAITARQVAEIATQRLFV
jgi:hypothetical protein